MFTVGGVHIVLLTVFRHNRDLNSSGITALLVGPNIVKGATIYVTTSIVYEAILKH